MKKLLYKLFEHKQERGDTIVEVLLAMAVLGMVLGTSFAIVNRSLATGRAAQERTEAQKLAEAQLEKLKLHSSNRANGYFDDFAPVNPLASTDLVFCIIDDPAPMGGLLRVVYTASSTQFTESSDIPATGPGGYDSQCRFGPDGRYRVSVKPNGNVFTIRVRWNPIGNGTTFSEVKMIYRTYPASSTLVPRLLFGIIAANDSVLDASVGHSRVNDQYDNRLRSHG
jgi:type II secretory pathway pseudopilin PulG